MGVQAILYSRSGERGHPQIHVGCACRQFVGGTVKVNVVVVGWGNLMLARHGSS